MKKGIFGYLPQVMSEEEQSLSIYEYFEDVDIYENYDLVVFRNFVFAETIRVIAEGK